MNVSQLNTPRGLALGILSLSLIAVLVGLFNTAAYQDGAGFSGKNASGKSHSKSTGRGINSILSSSVPHDHLMLVEVRGPIMMQAEQGGFMGTESMAVTARKALLEAEENDSVKGVLLWIDSPGGTVGMSQELHNAVARVSEKKPVVAILGDVAASGGYYTACAADKIVSLPGTLTASIGVIITTMNFKSLADKLGVQAVTIKSGKFKDLLSPFKASNPEEVALLQSMINTSYQQFLHAVVEGRTRSIESKAEKEKRAERIKAIADGRVVVGEEALKIGLVDALGDMTTARATLDKMAKEQFHLATKEELPLEEYSARPALLEILGIGGKASASASIMPNPMEGVTSFSMRHPNQPLWMME